MAKLYNYLNDCVNRCPKCGSQALGNARFHVKRSASFWSGRFPFLHFCQGYSLDHLHATCQTCGFKYAAATADAMEEAHHD